MSEVAYQVDRVISISQLKKDFSRKFPTHPLAQILLNEPDAMTIGSLIAKVGTWLVIAQTAKKEEVL